MLVADSTEQVLDDLGLVPSRSYLGLWNSALIPQISIDT